MINAGKISPSIADVPARRPRTKGGWIQDIRARVDLAGDRVGRLLAERGDASRGFALDETEGACVLDVMESDRDGGSARPMALPHRRQVEVRQDVAVEGEERLVPEAVEHAHDRAAGPEGLPLRDPRDLRATPPRRQERVERVLQVRRGHDHLPDSVLHEVIEDVVEDRPVDEREERLREGFGEWSHARALSPHEDDRFHPARSALDLMRGASVPPARSRRRCRRRRRSGEPGSPGRARSDRPGGSGRT